MNEKFILVLIIWNHLIIQIDVSILSGRINDIWLYGDVPPGDRRSCSIQRAKSSRLHYLQLLSFDFVVTFTYHNVTFRVTGTTQVMAAAVHNQTSETNDYFKTDMLPWSWSNLFLFHTKKIFIIDLMECTKIPLAPILLPKKKLSPAIILWYVNKLCRIFIWLKKL